jgi:hypothetical protein
MNRAQHRKLLPLIHLLECNATTHANNISSSNSSSRSNGNNEAAKIAELRNKYLESFSIVSCIRDEESVLQRRSEFDKDPELSEIFGVIWETLVQSKLVVAAAVEASSTTTDNNNHHHKRIKSSSPSNSRPNSKRGNKENIAADNIVVLSREGFITIYIDVST